MPIYTYQCEECGVRFDVRQKFSDDPMAECPECGGFTHRVPQPVGIVFKGSGWYAKDSKGSNSLATPGKRETETDAASASEMKPDAPASSAPATSTPESGSNSESTSD